MSPGGRRGPILVGVDGSAGSSHALEWAAALALDLGVDVVAVHTLGLLAHLGGEPTPAEARRADVEAALRGPWTEALRVAGVAHRCVVADGNPVTGLIGSAMAEGARLVVVGTRGTGGFPGLQLGSTSHQLAQHAAVPVAIVPPPAV